MPALWGKKLPVYNRVCNAQNTKCLAKVFLNQAQYSLLEAYLGKKLDLKQNYSILNIEFAFTMTANGNI